MSSIYKNNFEKIKEAYRDIFEALERSSKRFDIDYYLIGAQSRDVWTDHLNLIKRITRDIDYCIYVEDRNIWDRLNEFLVSEEGFIRDEQKPYRFYKGGMVDLIPFGGIENNGEVILDNPTTELSVYGYKEVTENAIIIDGIFKVITLSGLCIMKLVAYNEKPDHRAKDLDDFLFLVEYYHEIAGEELFAGHFDDLIRDDFEMSIASARMLGRNMSLIQNKNEKLKEKIINTLTNQLKGFNELEINQMYQVREQDDHLVIKLKLISETIKGINDKLL